MSVAGYNWQFVAIESFCLIVWLMILPKERTGSYAWWHLIGLICHSIGTIFRIGYWAIASAIGPVDGCENYPCWAGAYRGHLFWAIQLSTFGIGCMLRAYFLPILGKWWLLPAGIVGVIGYYFGVALENRYFQ